MASRGDATKDMWHGGIPEDTGDRFGRGFGSALHRSGWRGPALAHGLQAYWQPIAGEQEVAGLPSPSISPNPEARHHSQDIIGRFAYS